MDFEVTAAVRPLRLKAGIAGELPYPVPTSVGAQRTMRANRRSETGPEVAVRRLLHARGFRFRKDFRLESAGTRVRADIVFTRRHLAIFIDGCFWHGCSDHGLLPRRNSDYWGPKLSGNVKRDELVSAALAGCGWTVMRFWEHVPPEQIVSAIIERLRGSM